MGDTDLSTGLSKTRIEALTDGIFAIAMTLMVFDIKVPTVAQMKQLNLRHELIQLWPRFLAYVISFVMLGVYWVGHHNQYHYIRRTDRPFLWINIFFLMGVSLIPFSTGLLGQFPEDRTALGVYGLNLIMVGGFLYAHWSYAVREIWRSHVTVTRYAGKFNLHDESCFTTAVEAEEHGLELGKPGSTIAFRACNTPHRQHEQFSRNRSLILMEIR